ncbi:MAG: hypothetical protein KDA96_25345, partial [Planctomycetaceae bacterium]|nr:hypothetical protein [Planctomycetaceae bacterium]
LQSLHDSDCPYGRPEELVIRLRPDCGCTSVFVLTGRKEQVRQAASRFLQTDWMNWFDSVDAVFSGESSSALLRLILNAPRHECDTYTHMISTFATEHDLDLQVVADGQPAGDGLPDLMIKTTSDRSMQLADELSSGFGLRCVVLCYHGVIHAYQTENPVDGKHDPVRMFAMIVRSLEQELIAVGGDWRTPHFPRPVAVQPETRWLQFMAPRSDGTQA